MYKPKSNHGNNCICFSVRSARSEAPGENRGPYNISVPHEFFLPNIRFTPIIEPPPPDVLETLIQTYSLSFCRWFFLLCVQDGTINHNGSAPGSSSLPPRQRFTHPPPSLLPELQNLIAGTRAFTHHPSSTQKYCFYGTCHLAGVPTPARWHSSPSAPGPSEPGLWSVQSRGGGRSAPPPRFFPHRQIVVRN